MLPNSFWYDPNPFMKRRHTALASSLMLAMLFLIVIGPSLSLAQARHFEKGPGSIQARARLFEKGSNNWPFLIAVCFKN